MERPKEIEVIERETGMRQKRRAKLAKIYSKLLEHERIEVHKTQSELMRAHRAAYKDLSNEALAYMMLLIAVDKLDRLLHIEKQRNPHPHEVLNAKETRIRHSDNDRRKKKKSPLRDKVEIRYVKLILELRDERHFSWRKIAEYFKSFHHIDISYTYVRDIYLEHLKTRGKLSEA
jgi:hypothetical protein